MITDLCRYLGVGLAESICQLDIDVFRELNRAGSNVALDLLMVLLTVAGISYVIVLLSVPLWMKRKRELAFDLVVLVVLTTLLAETIKMLVDRSRPADQLEDVKTIISASGPSFPSAHAARAFAVAALLSVGGSRMNVIIAFALAAMVTVSRVYLGVHWPSDILAGAFLGVVIATLMIWLGRHWRKYRTVRATVIGRLSSVLARQSNLRQA